MAKRKVDITVFEPYRGTVSRTGLRRAVVQALESQLPGKSCQLGLVIADDQTLRRLNGEYRGVDEVTDVLSFSTTHDGHWEGEEERSEGDEPAAFPLQDPPHLGEVVISYPQAARQAGAGESGLREELTLLVVHGVLHLLGFDHEEPEAGADMRAREQEILSAILT